MEPLKERLRSYVESSTNEMLIADFDLPKYLNWAKGRPVDNSMLLANFLHEYTHRWCFDSPVGAAIAFLRLRASTRALLKESAFNDYVRTATAVLLLDPITEGLSLFAEFDSYPGESSFLSQTLVASTIFFAPAVETDNRPLILLNGMLQTLRRDPRLLERKAGIFVKKGFDPYLIGYLSVKSIWKQMAGASKALRDHDLFLSYLRSYFYDDPGMVVTLLSDAPSEIHAARNIANYILDRVRDLLSFEGLEEKVLLWVSSAEKGKVNVESIGSNEATERKADFMFQKAITEDFIKGGNYEQVATWTYMVLEERAICVLGKIAVHLDADKDGNVRIINKKTGETIYTTESPGLAEHSDGQLYIVAGREAHGLLSIVGIGSQTFLISSLGKFSERDLTLAKRLIANHGDSKEFFETIRTELGKDGVVNMVWQFVGEQIKQQQGKIYGPLCTLNATESEWPQVFSNIQELGLFGMLEYDADLTRAVAGVGLFNSYMNDIELIKGFAPLMGIDSDALQRALQLEKVFGLPIIKKSENSVLALV